MKKKDLLARIDKLELAHIALNARVGELEQDASMIRASINKLWRDKQSRPV